MKLKRKFAVVKLWPSQKTAENEVIERLKVAAQILNIDCIEISPNGYCIKTNKQITSDDVDFAIHLHFDTPKNYDIFSFTTLWNPLHFFFDFGYTRCCKNLTSHDDFLSCLSHGADDHVKRLLMKQPLHLHPKFTMFHSLSSPILQPTEKQRNLFYIGINWEKLGRGKSRHHDLLQKLDQTNYLRIYGPQKVQGVKVWNDFKSYVGELPFDGKSVIQAIHSEGVGLVLSSDAHREAGLMSNRLFESAAAGAVIICDDNPFARKHFQDSLLYIDPTNDPFSQVNHHMSWINANPEAAKELAVKSQNIFLQHFLLTHSLSSIYEQLENRKKELFFNLDPTNLQNPKVALIYILTDEPSHIKNDSIESCAKQDYRNLKVFIAVDSNQPEKTKSLEEKLKQNQTSYRILFINNLDKNYLNKLGLCVSEILQNIQNEEFEYFNIVLSHEEIFHNHISSLMRICTKTKNCIATTASVVWGDKIAHETHNESCFNEYEQIHQATGFSRFMLPKSTLQEKIFYFLPYLNKKSFIAFIRLNEYPIISSSLVTIRVHSSSTFFQLHQENHIEKQLIKEILDKKPIGAIYQRTRASSHKIKQIAEKIKPYIQKTPMPYWLRSILRSTYCKLKSKS